jgi:transposase
MGTLRVFVGLDYHVAFIQVCILDERGNVLCNRQCDNSWEALAELVGRYGQVVEAAIESCSGAADLAEELTARAGWSIHLSHPGFVARMKQNPDKTDFDDAHLLADLVRVGYLPRVWLAPAAVRELRQLVRYRLQLAQQRRNVKLRMRSLLRENRCRAPETVQPWTMAWLKWVQDGAELRDDSQWIMKEHVQELARLAAALQRVEKRLAKVTAQDGLVAWLLKQPGIGPITAWTLRAEIGRFDRFRTGKQCSRFCGLSPRNASSGQRQADAGLIRAANPELRRVLIEAAHRLARWSERWRTFAQRLKQAGKPGSVRAAAVANRWIRWLYHQVPAAA